MRLTTKDARDACIGYIMEIRGRVSEIERLVDGESPFVAQTEAAELVLETSRLMATIEAWHRGDYGRER